MTDDKKKNALPYGYVLDSGVYRYTVRSVLGMGGFGITYYGELKTRVGNINVDVPIAIKEFFPASLCERLDGTSTMSYSNPTKDQVERARKDFMGEARRLNSLANKHPNIVAVNEVFETNNTAYYVMEYLEGVSLDKYIKENGPMDEGRMLQVMRPIIDAVAFLHRHRVTHLDIKPANIMIVGGTVDTPERPVLIDFGLSKHYDAAGNATSTINSSGFSDGYAPKEQYRGITTFSPASDVYALGATMLYCLTGQRLPSSLDLKPGEVTGAIPAGVSPGLRRTLERALALDKEDRYLDAGQLLSAITSTAPDDSTRLLDSKFGEKTNNKSWLIFGSELLIGLLFIIFLFALQSSDNNGDEISDIYPKDTHSYVTNLDIVTETKDGRRRYFTKEEWSELSPSTKDLFIVKGIALVAPECDPFVLSIDLHYDFDDWETIKNRYGEENIPSKQQLEVWRENKMQIWDVEKAINLNNQVAEAVYWWSKTEDEDNSLRAWILWDGDMDLKLKDKSTKGCVRLVFPI